VVDNANGNPLALVEMPRSPSPLQLSGQEPLVGALPTPTSLEQAYLERVERLPPPARAMLLIPRRRAPVAGGRLPAPQPSWTSTSVVLSPPRRQTSFACVPIGSSSATRWCVRRCIGQ